MRLRYNQNFDGVGGRETEKFKARNKLVACLLAR